MLLILNDFKPDSILAKNKVRLEIVVA